MCNNSQPGRPINTSGLSEAKQGKLGSISEDFQGTVVSPKRPFFLKSGENYVSVQRRIEAGTRRGIISEKKRDQQIHISGIGIHPVRESYFGFKDQQEVSNYYHAVLRFHPHMALHVIEVKEVHKLTHLLDEKPIDPNEMEEF